MSDILSALLGTSSSSSTTSSSSSTYLDQIVSAYKATQKTKLNSLASQKSSLETKKSFYSSLQTKMSALQGNIDKMFAEKAAETFQARSAISSDTSVLTISASREAIVGVNSIKVEQLASSDLLIGERMNSSDAFAKEAGDYTFKINNQEITVTLDGSESNEQAVKKIVNAINSTKDITLSSSIVKDTSSTFRITFTANKTGEDNAISFDDNDSGILNALGLDNINGRAANDNDATKAHFKNENISELNSKLIVNGIEVTGTSNEVKDLLPGITINLLKAQEDDAKPVTTTTKIGTGEVVNFIKPILDSYNDLLNFAKSNTTILRSESSIYSLHTQLRNIFSTQLANVDEGDSTTPRFLSEIGIEVNSSGNLIISNQEKLEKVLSSDDGWENVANLFTSKKDESDPTKAYGLAARLQEIISPFTGGKETVTEQGLLGSRIKSLNSEINNISKRTIETEERINYQAENLRKQYSSLLEIMYKAQAQYGSLSNLFY